MVVFLFALFPPHLGESMSFFGVFVCFSCVFWSIGVCVEGVFSLSNIVNYRKKFYIHLQIATPKMPAQSW